MNTSDPTLDVHGLARTLVSLRSEGKQRPTSQFQQLPTDLETAMKTQELVSELEGIDSYAWKVAVSPDNRFVMAPLHPYLHGATKPALVWRPGMKLEVEIAVELGRDLPVLSTGAYSRSAVADAVSQIYLGAELVWSVIEDGATISYPLLLADRLGNMGYVLGPLLPILNLDPCEGTPLQVLLGGAALYDAGARHPAGDVLTWLLGYANDTSRPYGSLLAGSVITTGSLCGALDIAKPGEIIIRFGPETTFDFMLSAER